MHVPTPPPHPYPQNPGVQVSGGDPSLPPHILAAPLPPLTHPRGAQAAWALLQVRSLGIRPQEQPCGAQTPWAIPTPASSGVERGSSSRRLQSGSCCAHGWWVLGPRRFRGKVGWERADMPVPGEGTTPPRTQVSRLPAPPPAFNPLPPPPRAAEHPGVPAPPARPPPHHSGTLPCLTWARDTGLPPGGARQGCRSWVPGLGGESGAGGESLDTWVPSGTLGFCLALEGELGCGVRAGGAGSPDTWALWRSWGVRKGQPGGWEPGYLASPQTPEFSLGLGGELRLGAWMPGFSGRGCGLEEQGDGEPRHLGSLPAPFILTPGAGPKPPPCPHPRQNPIAARRKTRGFTWVFISCIWQFTGNRGWIQGAGLSLGLGV